MRNIMDTPVVSSCSLQHAYDIESTRYDAVRYDSVEGRFFNTLEVEWLARLLSPMKGKSILDVPTGTGRLAIPLAERGAVVTAGDVSEGMLNQAREKSELAGATDVEFEQVDATKLPYSDESFDAIVSFKFFHLLSEDVKFAALAEFRRVLKPGGRLIVEFNSPFYGVGLAFHRYYFRKRRAGGMRKKCLFPDQIARYFADFRVNAIVGVKLPFSGRLARVLGMRAMLGMNRLWGRIPILRYLCYGIMVAAERPDCAEGVQ
jgi:ubiquinone/menaquinone biosynthesis C-methylase UbiE